MGMGFSLLLSKHGPSCLIHGVTTIGLKIPFILFPSPYPSFIPYTLVAWSQCLWYDSQILQTTLEEFLWKVNLPKWSSSWWPFLMVLLDVLLELLQGLLLLYKLLLLLFQHIIEPMFLVAIHLDDLLSKA
jgi:hypothetical protein